MRLPNGEHAVADLVKLRDYVLNPQRPRGRHKARVFASALDIRQSHAESLRAGLLRAALEENAVEGEQDSYGLRCIVDFKCVRAEKSAIVRSHWIILSDEDSPRLVTCFVL